MFLVPQYASRRQLKVDDKKPFLGLQKRPFVGQSFNSVETEWQPDAFIRGVHALDCFPSITSQVPEALSWVREYEEKRLLAEL